MRTAALLVLWSLSLFSAGTPHAAEPLPSAVEEVRGLLRNGNIDAAVDAGDRAVKVLAGDARAWFWSARAYAQQALQASMLTKPKWAGRARDAYEKAVELDPALIDARFDLMQYYLAAPGFLGGGRDKADAQATQIARLDPVWGKVAESALANADKRPEAAEAALREAVKLGPEHARAHMAYAGLLQRQERWDELRTLWQDLLARQPEHALARYQLGRAAAITGEQLDTGLAYLDAFIAAGVIPEDLSMPAAHWRRGQILDKLGRRDEAIAALKLAVVDPQVKRQAQPDLDRIAGKG